MIFIILFRYITKIIKKKIGMKSTTKKTIMVKIQEEKKKNQKNARIKKRKEILKPRLNFRRNSFFKSKSFKEKTNRSQNSLHLIQFKLSDLSNKEKLLRVKTKDHQEIDEKSIKSIREIEMHENRLKKKFFSKQISMPSSQFGVKQNYFQKQWICKRAKTYREKMRVFSKFDNNSKLQSYNTKKSQTQREFSINNPVKVTKSNFFHKRSKTLPNFYQMKKKNKLVKFDDGGGKKNKTMNGFNQPKVKSRVFHRRKISGREPKEKFSMKKTQSRIFPGIFISSENFKHKKVIFFLL